jgi:hypothetical protein
MESQIKISVTTPTVRPEGVPILEKCLKRQTFQSFEWIIGTPLKYLDQIEKNMGDLNVDILLLEEKPKNEGDYYGLNKCFNQIWKEANGELIVNLVDWTWFPPDVLEKLWIHYQTDPKSCVSGIGHQYKDIVNGKPENRVWTDPRARLDQGSFYEVGPREMELCLASFPTKLVYDIGGIDEEFDKMAALSEKEMMARAERLGYTFWLDQDIEYRAFQHPRLTGEWDERYNKGCEYYAKCLQEIAEEKRLKLNYL